MEDLFNEEFWSTAIDNGINWLITEGPGLLIIIVLFFLLSRGIVVLIKRMRKTLISRAEKNESVDSDEATKRINTLTNIIQGVFIIILWIVFFMLLLQKVAVNIGPILASVGILGLAIGFGTQELVRDVITGFFVLLENQVRTGDVAVINGTGGLVEKIELRTITLRDFSGTVHVFQNGKINTLANMTKDWSAMVFDIGVAYKEDTQRVMDIIKQVGDELKEDSEFGSDIIEPIEVFGLDAFGDSAIIIKARIKTKPMKQWTIGREYRKRLKSAFDEQGIEIPFPHTTVYWGEEIKPLKLDAEKMPVSKS
ncbi:MAG: mechanosensitive ion channel family protein [Bacteroidota bacterium]